MTDPGPQKGPSSVWKIQAETQMVRRLLGEYYGSVNAVKDGVVYVTLEHTVDGALFDATKPADELPASIVAGGDFMCRTYELASGDTQVEIEPRKEAE